MAENRKHGNRPIFSTKFEKIVYILEDFGKQEHFEFWRKEYGKSSNPTDTDIA